MLVRQDLMSVDSIYTVNAFESEEGMLVAAGTEQEGASYLYHLGNGRIEKVGDGPGGVMSLVPVPGRNDMLVSVQGLFPPFKGKEAGIFRHWKKDGEWTVSRVIKLLFAHRCDIFRTDDGRNCLISCTVSAYKEDPADWSRKGCVYASILDSPEDDTWKTELLIDNLGRNHGMLKRISGGHESICVSGDEGIFSISADGKGFHIEKILDRPVSEFGFGDLDGDGKDELAAIEPFHGETVRFYHQDGDGWKPVAEDGLLFGHGLSVGKLGDRFYAAAGNRRGEKDLVLYSFDKDMNMEKQLVEHESGTTQTQFFRYRGADYLLASNQVLSEVSLYSLKNHDNKMKTIVYPDSMEVKHLPGRDLRWYFTPEMNLSKAFSMNVVLIKPGCTVTPAHSHPDNEEIIYVVSGEGKAYIDGKVYPIYEGTSVLFTKGCVHMLRNSGTVDMKVACFFTPQTTLADYVYHEDAKFPDNE